ncbi:MAG: RNA polymerase sigma factor, partial [bacterium]|nr:RNA polymerase sigma factor [bacterium]
MSSKKNTFNNIDDHNLIRLVLQGDKKALDSLVIRHKDWIYNVALRMTANISDAEEVCQEVLIKILTKLSTFKFKSSFRTWLYRITANHVMTMKTTGKESFFTSFDDHRRFFETLPDQRLGDGYPAPRAQLIEETKVECMLGMLLCLDREQRIVFTLGGIFGLDSKSGSVVLEMSESNYRKRLERARHDLKNYMDAKCGLVNENASCKCSRKTKAAIKAGYVDPRSLKFSDTHMKKIGEVAVGKTAAIDDAV